MQKYVTCAVCGSERVRITDNHLKFHGIDLKKYRELYPDCEVISEEFKSKIGKWNRIKIDNPTEDNQIHHDMKIPSHRTRKRMTYEEFLKMIEDGLCLREIIEMGYAKTQVRFYSSLARGAINITKEQFQEEYDAGKSLDDISRDYRISRENITQLRDFYGIKRKGGIYSERKKTEKPITYRQRKIIYGTLMGDGGRLNCVLKVKHSTKQKEYLDWMKEELVDLVSPKSYKISSYFHKKRNREYETVLFYTSMHSDVENILNDFYSSGKKTLTQNILDELDELSLAVWFMDDGKTDWYYRSIVKTGNNIRPYSVLCTDCFSYEEHLLMSDWFRLKWGLITTIKKNRRGHYRIVFPAESAGKFHKIIKPFVHSSMLYKVDYEAYKKKRASGIRT